MAINTISPKVAQSSAEIHCRTNNYGSVCRADRDGWYEFGGFITAWNNRILWGISGRGVMREGIVAFPFSVETYTTGDLVCGLGCVAATGLVENRGNVRVNVQVRLWVPGGSTVWIVDQNLFTTMPNWSVRFLGPELPQVSFEAMI